MHCLHSDSLDSVAPIPALTACLPNTATMDGPDEQVRAGTGGDMSGTWKDSSQDHCGQLDVDVLGCFGKLSGERQAP